MAKKAKQEEAPEEVKLFEITSASITDDLCNYSFEITDGIGLGDTHNVKGKGIIDDDLRNAFVTLNAHLAVIDDVFTHSDTDVDDINKMHGSELSQLYHVTGLKVKGSSQDESVILIGTKHVNSVGGRLDLITPKVPLNEFSSYRWAKELKKAVDAVRMEVELYKGGKCTALDALDSPTDEKQNTIDFSEEFETAKV